MSAEHDGSESVDQGDAGRREPGAGGAAPVGAGREPASGSEIGGRRAFVGRALAIWAGALGALLAIPSERFLRPRGRASGESEWWTVGRVGALQDDRPVELKVIGEKVDAWTKSPRVQLGSVWVRKSESGIEALSAECPHLGCRVGYDAAKRGFNCPCHASDFNLAGDVLTGPSPRAMDRLEARVEGELVQIRFKRFKTQLAKKIEVPL